MADLSVGIIQPDLIWENWRANAEAIERLIDGLQAPVDLVLLPEMFGSGFSMTPDKIAQDMEGPAVQWMSQTATTLQASLMGSLVIEDDGHYYNRLIHATPGGSLSYYDKRHLFTYAGEDKNYAGGNHRLITTVKGWRICPLVCYDLRFPVWSRNDLDYDLLVYVANWPAPRIEAWSALLKARAIENLSFCIGVNRVGSDPLGNDYLGASSAYDHAGTLLHDCGAEEAVAVVRLDKGAMEKFREQYNFLADRDSYTIH